MTTFTNVALSNTFNEFRQAHNDVGNTLTNITSGSSTNTTWSSESVSVNTSRANTLLAGDASFTNANTTNAKITSLTSGRVVLAGTDGVVQDDSGLTFNTTTNALTVTGTTTSGNVTTGGTLSVTGASTLTGNVQFGTETRIFAANGTIDGTLESRVSSI